MTNPNLRIMKKLALLQLREVVDVSDKEEQLCIRRELLKLAEEIQRRLEKK